MNNRIRLIREYFGGSQKVFAASLGLSQQTYANYESGKAAIPDSLKQKLFVMGVNMNWLISGVGEMIYNQNTNNSDDNNESTYITPSGKTFSATPATFGSTVPVLASKVSAGTGMEWVPAEFDEDNRLPIPDRFFKGYDLKDIFAAQVIGDSMKNIELISGDYVFAVHGLLRGSGIYVIAIDGEAFVKRLEVDRLDKKIAVISENEHYEPRIVDPERITILGKVIGWLHRYPY